jgi:hypothetical protein
MPGHVDVRRRIETDSTLERARDAVRFMPTWTQIWVSPDS